MNDPFSHKAKERVNKFNELLKTNESIAELSQRGLDVISMHDSVYEALKELMEEGNYGHIDSQNDS